MIHSVEEKRSRGEKGRNIFIHTHIRIYIYIYIYIFFFFHLTKSAYQSAKESVKKDTVILHDKIYNSEL